MNYLSFLVACLITPVLSAQSMKLTALSKSDLPKGVSYKGKLQQAVRWTDESGVNLVLTSKTDETLSPSADSEDYRDASLYAYHFLLFEDSVAQTWKVSDYVKECPLDIVLNFIENTFQVTDLDNDGAGEVWLMYKIDCVSDVSPIGMKVIMYEGTQKFAMRGENTVEPSKGNLMGGDYKFDKAFNEGPASFQEFAKKLWKANLKNKWE